MWPPNTILFPIDFSARSVSHRPIRPNPGLALSPGDHIDARAAPSGIGHCVNRDWTSDG